MNLLEFIFGIIVLVNIDVILYFVIVKKVIDKVDKEDSKEYKKMKKEEVEEKENSSFWGV